MAADIGDATDFVGLIDGEMHRIDVTTNTNFKRLISYEPLQLQGARYKIAVLDDGKFDLIDINFPFCPRCGTGRILPTGILLEENRSEDGSSLWSNDQLLMDVCNGCGEIKVEKRITTPFHCDFNHVYKELKQEKNNNMELCELPIDNEKEATAYARRACRFLSDSFGTRLVAVGGKHYKVTNPSNADGYWTYQFVDRLALVDGHLGVEYPCDVVDK